jgi:hypothetical protein
MHLWISWKFSYIHNFGYMLYFGVFAKLIDIIFSTAFRTWLVYKGSPIKREVIGNHCHILQKKNIYVSKCVYVYVHISLFLPECACTTIIDISPRIFSLMYCCCVSIIIVICLCPPGGLDLVNKLISISI